MRLDATWCLIRSTMWRYDVMANLVRWFAKRTILSRVKSVAPDVTSVSGYWSQLHQPIAGSCVNAPDVTSFLMRRYMIWATGIGRFGPSSGSTARFVRTGQLAATA
eukprot:3232004-Rhodomonas_salina.1